MNKREMPDKFSALEGKIKTAWSRLTDNEIALYEGRPDAFYDVLEERYGLSRAEAESQVSEVDDADTVNTYLPKK